MKTLPVAVCIVEQDGKFPLIKFKRNYLAGRWGLPGGKLDADEHAPEAAIRELREEVGVETEFQQLVAVVDEIALDREGNAIRCILFVCRMKLTKPASLDKRELPEGDIEWFTLEQIKAMETEFVCSDFKIFLDLNESKWHGNFRSRQEWKNEKLQLTYFEPVD